MSAPGTVLADGTPLPAEVGNGTIIMGFPAATLKNAIETAGNLDLIQAVVQLTGTEFGVKPPSYPMPLNINVTNDGYNCSTAKLYGSMSTTSANSDDLTRPSFCFLLWNSLTPTLKDR